MKNLDLVVGLYLMKFRGLSPGFVKSHGCLCFWMFLSSTQSACCQYGVVRQRSGTASESSVIKHSSLSSINRILLCIWSRWLVVQNRLEGTSCECPHTCFTILCFVFVFSFAGINTVTAKSLWYATTVICPTWEPVTSWWLSWLGAGSDQTIYWTLRYHRVVYCLCCHLWKVPRVPGSICSSITRKLNSCNKVWRSLLIFQMLVCFISPLGRTRKQSRELNV